MASKSYPVMQAGFGVFFLKLDMRDDGTKCLKILLGKRKGAHGAGQLSLPGGKPDFGETLKAAVPREAKEETDLDIVGEPWKLTWSDDFFPAEQLSFVTLYYVADKWEGVPKTMEPDKCEGWDWYDIEALDGYDLFCGTRNAAKVLYQHYAIILERR